jgi:CubicO group peptidase (beta-lactamase class C family)
MEEIIIPRKIITLLLLLFILIGCKSDSYNTNKTVYIANKPTLIKKKIEKVENGLLPAILIKNAEVKRYNIHERMNHYKVTGVSIAVINNGEIEWAKGYGVKENGTDDSVTVMTLFQAASLTKPIVGAVVLHLVEKDMIDLESPVNDQLKSWKIPENEFTRRKSVTPKMLLLHTGGVTGFGASGYAEEDKIPTLLQILDGLEPANNPPIGVDFEPGSRWRYSNGGYLILQQLLSDVTNSSFIDLMKEIVLEPLSMTNSTFTQPLSSKYVKEAAAGHTFEGAVVEGKWRIIPELAVGSLWTNPMDLCKFIIELQKSIEGNSNKILSKSMTENMLSKHYGNMGLGIGVGGDGKDLQFGFNGGNPGYNCDMFAYAYKDKGAVIMTNSDNGYFLLTEIYRSISAEYEWSDHKPKIKEIAEIDKKIYEEYVGTYHSEQEIRPDFDIKVERENDLLYASFVGEDFNLIPQGKKYNLIPESEQKFFIAEHDWEIEFVKGEIGKVNSIRYFIIIGPGTAQRTNQRK